MKKKYVYVLKVLNPDMKAYGGFQWPEKGRVVAPDWDPRPICGGGLHGWLNGEGDTKVSNVIDIKNPLNRWLVLKVDEKEIVNIDNEKVKFKSCTIIFNGTRDKAIDFLKSKNSELVFTNWIVKEYPDYEEIKIGSESVIKAGKKSKIKAKKNNLIYTSFQSSIQTESDTTLVYGNDCDIESHDNSKLIGAGHNNIKTGESNLIIDGSANKIITKGYSDIIVNNYNVIETGDGSVVISRYDNKLSAGKNSILYGESDCKFKGCYDTFFICNVNGMLITAKVDNKKIKCNVWYHIDYVNMKFKRYYEFNSLDAMKSMFGEKELQKKIDLKFKEGLIPRKWKVK